MPDYQFFTTEAALRQAAFTLNAFTTSKLRLTKAPYVPTPTSTRTDLRANECDFDGYPTGGYAIAAYTGPLNYSGGGAVITSPLVNVAYGPAGSPPVGNSVSGWWIEDSAGNVVAAASFSPARPMATVGDGFPWIDQIVLFRNSPPTG